MRKPTTLLVLLLLCTLVVFGGETIPEGTEERDLPFILEKGNVWKSASAGIEGKYMLTVGLGFNSLSDITSINYTQSKFWNDSLGSKTFPGLGINTFTQSPFFNLMLDYGVTDKISAGIALGYQTMSIEWGTTNVYYTDNWTRFAAALRADYHFVAKKKMSLYGGARLGYNFYSMSSDFTKFDPSYTRNFDGRPTKLMAQIHGGFSYFLNGFFGINAELGYSYGENYYAGIGLAFKF